MDIDYFIRESLDKLLWDEPQEACQDNQIDVERLHTLHEFRIVETCLVDQKQRNAKVFGTLVCVSILVVADHAGYINIRIRGKIFGDALQIGAAA